MNTIPALSLPARLRRVVAQDALRRAHAYARAVHSSCEGRVSYRRCLAAGLAAAHAGDGRAMKADVLAAQALAWAAHVRACGGRFDVDTKACDALRFSLAHNLRGFCLPTKLEGTKPNQDTAAALAERIAARGAFQPLALAPAVDGLAVVAVGRGLLGRLQAKHVRWAAQLPAFRVAALAVTGGTEERPTMGVNVALEVWPVLPERALAAPAPAPAEEAMPEDALEAWADALDAEAHPDWPAVMPLDPAEERATFGGEGTAGARRTRADVERDTARYFG